MDEQIYEINIKRFIQSTEFQLQKLADCIYRLNEFQGYEDWTNVKQAHLNASQIVKRIKSDIKEMEKIRKQVVSTLNDKSSNQVVNRIDEQLKEIAKKLAKQTDAIDSISAPYHQFALKNSNYILEAHIGAPEMYSYELQKNEYIAQDKSLCNAYDQLQQDCEDLKRIMEIFSKEIYKQKETIDSIEKNITDTEDNLEAGSSYLGNALKYKAFGTAASGALIGTVVGGPVGFLAGAKIGAIVGIGSGAIGYLAAKYFKK